MNKNIILGIIALVFILGALWISGVFGGFSEPINTENLAGSWNSKLVLTYADGSQQEITGEGQTGTLYYNGQQLSRITNYLYINPTNSGGDYSNLVVIVDPDKFNCKYDVVSDTTGIAFIDGADYMLEKCNPFTGLDCDYITGMNSFYIDQGQQLFGHANFYMPVYETNILPIGDDYIITFWYDGYMEYYISEYDPDVMFELPAPTGSISLSFESVDGPIGSIINIDWDYNVEVE